MLPGSRRRTVATAIVGALASVGAMLLNAAVALPASAAPAFPGAPGPGATPLIDLPLLDSVMSVLDSRSPSVPNSVTGWYADPATNSVVVSATDDNAARTFAAGQPAVRIEHVTTRPRLLADLHGGDTLTTANGVRCSAGFNAVSGNIRYIITAGHCAKLGGSWAGPNGSTIGPATRSTFPGHDFGLIQVSSADWDQTRLVDADGGFITVAGTLPAKVGDQVCLSGSTSGFHCGQVEAFNETVNYGDGDVVRGLTRTSVCAEAGDSGGPFMSGNMAQGLLSGGAGGCLLGGQSYFQPIKEVLSTYGLTLLTGRAPDRDER